MQPKASKRTTRRNVGRSSLRSDCNSDSKEWQDIAVPVLERIFDIMLAEQDGSRMLKTASHVCAHWRQVATEVILSDTAVSRPERPPMPLLRTAFVKPAYSILSGSTNAAVVQSTEQSFEGGAFGEEEAMSPLGRPSNYSAPSYRLRRRVAIVERPQVIKGNAPSRRNCDAEREGSVHSGLARGHSGSESESDGSTRIVAKERRNGKYAKALCRSSPDWTGLSREQSAKSPASKNLVHFQGRRKSIGRKYQLKVDTSDRDSGARLGKAQKHVKLQASRTRSKNPAQSSPVWNVSLSSGLLERAVCFCNRLLHSMGIRL